MSVEEKIQSILPPGVNPVIGDLPGATDSVTCVVAFNGNPNTEYFGKRGLTTLFNPIVKIVVRHKDYEIGSTWVEQIKSSLHRHRDNYFLNILMVGSPMYLGRGEQRLHEFQVTFSTTVKE